MKAQRIELRNRSMEVISQFVLQYDDLHESLPDVIVEYNPAGAPTIFHQVAQGKICTYVESIIFQIGEPHASVGSTVGQSVAAGDAGAAGGRDMAAPTDPGQ